MCLPTNINENISTNIQNYKYKHMYKNKTIKVTVKLKGTAQIDEKPSGEISEKEDIVFLTKNHELNKPVLEIFAVKV